MNNEQEQPIIQGRMIRITRLNDDGTVDASIEPIEIKGSMTGRLNIDQPNVQEIDEHGFKRVIVDMEIKPISLELLAMITGEEWRLHPMYQEMGAWAEFDYAGDGRPFDERLGNCYEIAAHGATLNGDRVTVPDQLPCPARLVHGTYSHPDTRDKPIRHAWVEMDDGSIWEPISSLLYDPAKFAEFTQAVSDYTYTVREAALNMLRTGHYGRWEE